MTSSPHPDDPDTEGTTLPPYEGRKKAADVSGAEESTQVGAKTAGATGPVEDDAFKAPDPADTERGEHASPADEQPASESADSDLDPDVTGPAHEPGTGRAEDQP